MHENSGTCSSLLTLMGIGLNSEPARGLVILD